jgi:hypothetical protein
MTDTEINQALALAVGWKRMLPNPEADGLKQCWVWTGGKWRLFDHKDWNVIGPIAQKYDLFPHLNSSGTWTVWTVWAKERWHTAHTPQKAIALALIERTKK